VGTVVETTCGVVRGIVEGPVTAFYGIPYAAPPVGPLRLRAPRPCRPWLGVRDATRPGPGAPQIPPPPQMAAQAPDVQDEDCLTVNVWTPAVDGGRRPVMVWIHGGGFTGGAGSVPLYRGGHLAARGDVVVVTGNYRLGVLGFAAHPDLADDEAGGVAGNWGLLDQVAALRWVHDTIAAFGGDPDRVTVFGESAGAMSIGALLTMPAAQGLFHRAIQQSGPPLAVPMARAEQVTAKVLAELGLERPDQLATASVDDIIDAQRRLSASDGVAGLPLVPVVDGVGLPAHPATAFDVGAEAPVPLVIGTNRDEATFFLVGDRAIHELDEATMLRRLRRFLAGWGVDGDVEALVAAYRASRAERGEPTDARSLWTALLTDGMFRIGSIREAAAHAGHGHPTWSYLFTWPSPAMGGTLGSCHAVDIPFVLGTLDAPGMDRFAGSGPRATALSERMMDTWATFARTGDPTGPAVDDWPRYDTARRATAVIGDTVTVVDAPGEAERLAWEQLAPPPRPD
jgi:para-nitrobenzyl esterase